MTLDEAIKHCEEKAKEQKEKATAIARAKEPFYKYAECAECAKDHEQLAEWLKELKAYKETPQVVLFADGMTEEEKQKLIAEFKAVMDNADLISRSALKENLRENHYFGMFTENICEVIDNAPTVETYTEEDMKRTIKENFDLGYEMAKNKYERPKGEWIEKPITEKFGIGNFTRHAVVCSVCEGSGEDSEGIPQKTNFCPNCGADMRGEKE